ncbi:unnamed protein product [Ectocarpus sp. 13 AM-2016]
MTCKMDKTWYSRHRLFLFFLRNVPKHPKQQGDTSITSDVATSLNDLYSTRELTSYARPSRTNNASGVLSAASHPNPIKKVKNCTYNTAEYTLHEKKKTARRATNQ